MVIPMKAIIKDIKNALEKRNQDFEREEFKNHSSVDLLPENM